MALPGILNNHPRKRNCELFGRHAEKFVIDSVSGCWNWTGAKQSNGYGRAWDGERSDYAHRVMFEIFSGEIPAGSDLDHLCRNRLCVNPVHLEPVSRSENLKRGDTGENIAQPLRDKTHCPSGHPYSGSNLRVANGRRHCRACARNRYHKRKELIANG